MTNSVKVDSADEQFGAILTELFSRVPFLKLILLKKEGQVAPRFPQRADWIANVMAGERQWTLLLEQKRLGQPREVRTAVLELKQALSNLPKSTLSYGVVLAPFISEESARLCTEAGVGYADLAGNVRLSFDHVFIETRVAENPFREKRETRSLFAPKATRVVPGGFYRGLCAFGKWPNWLHRRK